MTGRIWEYRPVLFKTEHHDGAIPRTIMIGPQGQDIIRPFLRLNVGGCLFTPKQSEAERSLVRRAERKTPLWPSHVRHQADKKGKQPGRKAIGDQWHPNAYRKAIAQACDRAFRHPELDGIPKSQLSEGQRTELDSWRKTRRWHPNQLRHAMATLIRRRYGAEAAQSVLGHAELSTTEIYAEKSLEAARQIMSEIG
jgi:hypothetical protein